ncbi:MAG: hypothetical protein AAF724_02610 [Pseudomonadota bacterium]
MTTLKAMIRPFMPQSMWLQRRAARSGSKRRPVKTEEAKQSDRPYTERFPARRDTKFFEIGEGLTLAVFWKDLPIGRGPAFSIHAGTSEPLKFDCFGDGGHYHTECPVLGQHRESRIWMFENSRKAQVDRAIFEIERNADYYICRTPKLAGRFVRTDPEKLHKACSRARQLAYQFIETIPELKEPAE